MSSRKLEVTELRGLAPGSQLIAVYKHGSLEVRNPAKFLRFDSGGAHILTFFSDQPQRKVRWSVKTNRPVGEKFYQGDAWLEQTADF